VLADQEFERHQSHLPVDTNNTNCVVTCRANRAGHMRTMIVYVAGVVLRWRIRRLAVIKDGCVVMRKVPYVDVVNESVAIVINSGSCDFTRIGPDVVVEVFVINVDSRIDNSDYNVSTTSRDIPRLLRTNVHPGCSGIAARSRGLSRIVESPHLRI